MSSLCNSCCGPQKNCPHIKLSSHRYNYSHNAVIGFQSHCPSSRLSYHWMSLQNKAFVLDSSCSKKMTACGRQQLLGQRRRRGPAGRLTTASGRQQVLEGRQYAADVLTLGSAVYHKLLSTCQQPAALSLAAACRKVVDSRLLVFAGTWARP